MTGGLAVTGADTRDPADELALAWIAGKRSVHTRRAYGRDIGVLVPQRASSAPSWLAWCSASGIDPLSAREHHVALYARALDSAGLSAASRARRLAALSGFYAYLTRRGHVAVNPAIDVARPVVDADASSTPGLTRDQALALVQSADTARGPQRARTAALIAVMLFSGARVGELVSADIEDLGTDRGHRVLRVTRKGGRQQALALPPPAAERLDAYLAGRSDMAHLPATAGHAGHRARRPLFATSTGARLFAPDIWALIRRLGEAAGLPADLVSHLGPHSLRHSFATLYLDAGGNLRDLQDALGHADPRTTRRYDRARHSLDRSPGYALAAFLGGATPDPVQVI
jgi:site-specific recombinase XerD